jgi:signal transduction histidine kinase/ActR/RegA family two-component response regulator
MGTSDDQHAGSQQRSLRDNEGNGQADIREQLLLRKIEALEQEVAVLRKAARDNAALEGMVAQLREANENLVLATVSAQGLRDEAEATNRRQNEFLAMLAHELRNPLAPISMAAALLERIPAPPKQLLNLTQVVRRQVDHMARLLDDLLDAARISSGKITLSLEPIVLSDVIEQALETVYPRINERGQHLYLDLPDEPIVVGGDPVRLTQVFTNLLGNASKYTSDRGEIRLSAKRDGGDVEVRIADNGYGIGPDVIPHIFDLFTQGPRSLARSEGGLGVGLNVVRNLVSMHGGTVEASSSGIGEGSTFAVRLPVSSGTPAVCEPVVKPVAGRGQGCQILLIEDNIDASDTLKHFLALEGHEVTAAYDGVSGLQLAVEGQYDVVICDIGLPGLDGFDVISRLRRGADGRRPLAIALSGYSQTEDRARALKAGFDNYFVKPVSPDALVSLIASPECLARRAAP